MDEKWSNRDDRHTHRHIDTDRQTDTQTHGHTFFLLLCVQKPPKRREKT
jgi:hypothetical protein